MRVTDSRLRHEFFTVKFKHSLHGLPSQALQARNIETRAARTSATSIEAIGSRCSTVTLPSGCHRLGSLGPKSTTPGAPVAAARCDTPESLPTKAVAIDA